jgi:hypothetical protein
MSFVELLGDLAPAGEAGFSRSQLGSLVSAGLDEGLSGNKILQGFADAGIGVRRSDGLSLISQVRGAMASTDAVQSLAMDQIPTSDSIAEWSGGRADSYLYRVRMYIREGGEGGLGFYQGNFDIVSDELITPAEAQQRARDIWESGEGQDLYAERQLWGTSLGGVYHQSGPS